RCERQIEIQVTAAHAKEPMGLQHDVEIKVAAAAAVQAFAAFTRESQALAVGDAFRYARLKRVRLTSQPALLVVLRHLQVEIEHRAAVRLFEGDGRRHFVVLSWYRNV